MPQQTQDAAIRRTVADVQRHQSDVEPFLGLHTDDAIVVNLVGRRVLGRAGLRDAMEQAMQTPLADVLTTADVEEIRYPSDDVAIVSCRKLVFDGRPTDDVPTATGLLTYVLVRQDDAWQVALAQTTPVVG